jgi:hypothetical protein
MYESLNEALRLKNNYLCGLKFQLGYEFIPDILVLFHIISIRV